MALSDEYAQTIEERAEHAYRLHVDGAPLDRNYPDLAHDYFCDVTALLAEYKRQQAGSDALHKRLCAERDALLAFVRLASRGLIPETHQQVYHLSDGSVLHSAKTFDASNPLCGEARRLLAELGESVS